MTTPKAVRYVPLTIRTNSLAIAHVVKFLPNTTRAGFDPKPIYVVVFIDKWHWDRFNFETCEFPCECCVNIHETKIDAVKFNKFVCNIYRNFRKPNQLQATSKETYTKLQHFERNW
jgi:hypothetical protein